MDDPRHAPLYSIPECARYLGLPVSTVRGWVTKPGSDHGKDGQPLVVPAGSDPTALSFINLVELHVLALLRRKRKTPLLAIRSKIYDLSSDLNVEHPLASRELLAYSHDDRTELDESGSPCRYLPFTRGFGHDDPKLIAIDPMVRFGRPVIKGSGVSTSAIARFAKGGESIVEMAEEYRLQPEQIAEAARFERVE